MRIIIGILVVVAGFMITWKSEWMMRNFGRVEWAEEHVGGSRFFYKLIGVVAIFLGLFIITGIWTDILNSIADFFV
jgi:hypothetical protein